MSYLRLHKQVFIWWGKWWAVQLYLNRYISLGIHIDFERPVIDIHFLWFIIAIGKRPELSPSAYKHRLSYRGFIITDEPIL